MSLDDFSNRPEGGSEDETPRGKAANNPLRSAYERGYGHGTSMRSLYVATEDLMRCMTSYAKTFDYEHCYVEKEDPSETELAAYWAGFEDCVTGEDSRYA